MIYCKAEKCKSFFRKFHDCTVPRTERLENVTLACAVRRGCVRQAPEQQLLQAALPSFFASHSMKKAVAPPSRFVDFPFRKQLARP